MAFLIILYYLHFLRTGSEEIFLYTCIGLEHILNVPKIIQYRKLYVSDLESLEDTWTFSYQWFHT